MIRDAAAAPLEETSLHRKLVDIARLPLLACRPILGVCMNIPRLRRELGTYGVSSGAVAERSRLIANTTAVPAELWASRCGRQRRCSTDIRPPRF